MIVWSVKPAEEGIGQGIILRVWNQDIKDAAVIISSALQIVNAKQTTHVETDIQSLSPVSGMLKATIGHNKIETFRLQVK